VNRARAHSRMLEYGCMEASSQALRTPSEKRAEWIRSRRCLASETTPPTSPCQVVGRAVDRIVIAAWPPQNPPQTFLNTVHVFTSWGDEVESCGNFRLGFSILRAAQPEVGSSGNQAPEGGFRPSGGGPQLHKIVEDFQFSTIPSDSACICLREGIIAACA